MSVSSSIRLNERQVAVLEWVKAGRPADVFDDDGYSHRITARALESRGLVLIRGHGANWVVELTERGKLWPEATEEDERERMRRRAIPSAYRRMVADGALDVDAHTPDAPSADAAVRASRRIARHAAKPKAKLPTKIVEKRETSMRYKVMVTRVQVAERWVRATDEEDAAKKVQAEFEKPYGYFGSWATTASEVEVVEVEQTTVITPNPLSKDGPMLLGLKDAARALGISYSMLYELTNKGDIEWAGIGTRKYISRESLLGFIKENTHRGYRSRY